MKNSAKERIHSKRSLFFAIGLVISFMLIISAFEWKFYQYPVIVLDDVYIEQEVLMEIVPTVQHPPKPKVMVNPVMEEIQEDEILEDLPQFVVDVEQRADEPLPDLGAPGPEKIEKVRVIAEIMPVPDRGYEAFYRYVNRNIRYPKMARRGNIEGKVFISFVVDMDGSLTNISLLRGIGGGCDEEALRVLKSAEAWIPGKQNGKPVKVSMVIPITFILQ